MHTVTRQSTGKRAWREPGRVWECMVATVLLGTTMACDQGASVLTQHGESGAREAALGWFLVITSCVVILIIGVLVLVAALRRRSPREAGSGDTGDAHPLVQPRDERESRWFTTFAVALPAVVLTVAFVFTIATVDAVEVPAHRPVGTITVTGHQWWWEVAYSDFGGPAFTTANEIHLPVGQSVRVVLHTGDVLHAFWVPQLAGKMEMVPGQSNQTWLEARTAGTFAGPCGQYCGDQHAHMRLTVVAKSPADFALWLAKQQQAAPAATDSELALGRSTFMRVGCATCHTIRGTDAGGSVGPDLTHFASRRMLAAGVLPNTPANLQAWIYGAQGIKPGSDMPSMAVPPQDLPALIAYLETLE